MSVARVYTIQKSRARRKSGGKLPSCEKCRTVINIGDPYRYFYVGFRSNYEHVRCMKSTCTPRTSELESSRLADAYAAQESAEDELNALSDGDPGDKSDIESIVETYAEALTDLAGEYRDADEQFGGGGMTDNGERADNLEAAADELGSFSVSEDEPDLDQCDNEKHDLEESDPNYLERDADKCDDCSDIRRTWWEDAVQEALDAIQEVSFEG